MTPTPDQPRPDAAAMTTARTVEQVLYEPMTHFHGLVEVHADAIVKAQLAALAEAGLVVVERDDLELAVEWMDQTMNPFGDDDGTWADALLTRDNLKDALAARQGEDQGQ